MIQCTQGFPRDGMTLPDYQEYFDRQPEIYEGILDGLRSGLNFNAAAWGVSAGKSLDKLQRAVERRNPWRNERNRYLESLSFSEVINNPKEPEYCIDINGERAAYFLANPDLKPANIDISGISRSFALAKSLRKFGYSALFEKIYAHDEQRLEGFLAPVLPLFTDTVKQKFINASHLEFLTELDSFLSLKGDFGVFRLCESEEELDKFAHHLADSWMQLVNSNRSLSVHFLGPLDTDFAQTVCAYLALSLRDLIKLLNRYQSEFFENRLCSPVWVRQRLRSVKAMRTAEFYRRYGFVHNHGEKVIADQVLADRAHARQRNKDTLDNTVIYNEADHEEWLSLSDAAAASVSNPENRRTELMVRVKGFEESAKRLGHQGLFVTFTCPSRFHAYHHTGEVNQNWLDAGRPSVRDSHDWLQSNWRRLLRRVANTDIRLYGFRFSEPHHDGCEHWHLVLFMEKKHVTDFRRMAKKVYLEDMPDEPGAKKRRVKIKFCDPKKGSAVGYCAAYVAKNIDGKSLESITDSSPLSADTVTVSENVSDMIARVDAWRSAFKIHQFQQIGGASVQVWREFRRCREEFKQEDAHMYPEFKDLTTAEWFALEVLRRSVSEEKDFDRFCMAMGGVTVKRADQAVRCSYRTAKAWQKVTASANAELWTDEELQKFRDSVNAAGLTKYGDMPAAQIGGFIFCGLTHITRNKNWKAEDKAIWMRTVSEQFDQLISHDDYYAMAQEEYEAYQQMLDEAQSEIDNALVFIEDPFDLSRFEPVDDIYELLDSPVSDRFVLVSSGGGEATAN